MAELVFEFYYLDPCLKIAEQSIVFKLHCMKGTRSIVKLQMPRTALQTYWVRSSEGGVQDLNSRTHNSGSSPGTEDWRSTI